MHRLRGHKLATYVMDASGPLVSVVALPGHPEFYGFTEDYPHLDALYRKATSAGCNMIAGRIGGRWYCIIGRISHRDLSGLFVQIYPS